MTTEITSSTTSSLHHRFPGQTSAQPAHVYLNPETGELSTAVDYTIGAGVPVDVWHGRRLRWAIPALTESAQADLLEQLHPLAARIVEGYSEEWDGHNTIGRLTDDAQDASNEARDLCGTYAYAHPDCVTRVWDAAEWLRDATAEELGITVESTDEQIEEIAARVSANASTEGVDVLEGLSRHLEHVRCELQQDDE